MGKSKLPWLFGNGERVIYIYATRYHIYIEITLKTISTANNSTIEVYPTSQHFPFYNEHIVRPNWIFQINF